MSDLGDIMERGFDIALKGFMIVLALGGVLGVIILGFAMVSKFPFTILGAALSFGIFYLLGRYAPNSWG